MSPDRPHFGFDMDGTVIDTTDFFERSCLTAFREHDLPLTREEFREQFGTGKRTLAWLEEMGITDQGLIDRVIGTRDAMMIALLETETRWMPGAPETLQELRRRQESLTIITNANDAYIAAVRRRLPEIDDFVSDLIGPGNGRIPPKPDPAGILQAMEKAGVPAERFVYTGDQLFDCLGARNARVKFCAFHGEHTHPRALEESDYRVGDIRELLEIRLTP